MRKSKSARLPGRPLAYVQDTIDPSLIRLMNGQMLRQPIPEVPLCINKRGWVYSLTHAGLRRRRTNFWKKNHYGKRTRSGNSQGQVYPYVTFRNVTYRIHELMAQAWLRAKAYGEAIDHINGDIDNCELINLRVISKKENDRCGGILKRMRNAARRLKEPRLDPLNISQKKLLEIFDAVVIPKSKKKIDYELLRLVGECAPHMNARRTDANTGTGVPSRNRRM